MNKWIAGLLLGLAVIGAVYFMREHGAAPDRGAQDARTDRPTMQARHDGSTETPMSGDMQPGGAKDEPKPPPPLPEGAAGDLSVDGAWARETSAGRDITAIYLVLIQSGGSTDRLTGATSSGADSIEIHDSRVESGVMVMRKLDYLDIDPDTPIAFEPEGLHLMAIGLKKPLSIGDRLPLVLHFAKAGDITVDVPVGESAAVSGLGHADGD